MMLGQLVGAAAVVLAGCARTADPSPNATGPEGRVAPSADRLEPRTVAPGLSPYDVVILDLLARDDLAIRRSHAPVSSDGTFAVDPETLGESPFAARERISSELDPEQWSEIEDLVDVLVAVNRTRRAVALHPSIDGAIVRDSAVPFSSYAVRPSDEVERQREDGARGRVGFWAPAFSPDGRRALVRVRFGPTPHGASATYVLERGPGGAWTVEWSKLAFYA
jgi:hypothetical protein